MDLTEVALAAAICATCFICGVVFAKIVLSDLQATKEHVTSEVGKLRGEFSALLSEAVKRA